MTNWKNEPFILDVEKGDTKAFCMCGLSKNAPFWVVFKILCHSSKLYKKGMTYYDRNRI